MLFGCVYVSKAVSVVVLKVQNMSRQTHQILGTTCQIGLLVVVKQTCQSRVVVCGVPMTPPAPDD